MYRMVWLDQKLRLEGVMKNLKLRQDLKYLYNLPNSYPYSLKKNCQKRKLIGNRVAKEMSTIILASEYPVTLLLSSK